MSEPFIAEVRIFAGNFAPRGWAFCNGQILPIAQNTALFSLIGTTYGGDGRTTTALPDMQGRAPMHPGNGPGLSSRRLGERSGTSAVTLTEAELPAHGHTHNASPAPSASLAPDNGSYAARSIGGNAYVAAAPDANLNAAAVTVSGGGQAHNNMQPFTALNFIIALVGIYPSRA